MTEQIHARGEGGGCFVLSLPLHEAIEEQITKGTLTVTEPTAECGHEFDASPVEPVEQNEHGGSPIDLGENAPAVPPGTQLTQDEDGALRLPDGTVYTGPVTESAPGTEPLVTTEVVDNPNPGGATEPPTTDAPQAPKASANKGAWVEYAVAKGMSEENATAANKGDLIAKFGA